MEDRKNVCKYQVFILDAKKCLAMKRNHLVFLILLSFLVFFAFDQIGSSGLAIVKQENIASKLIEGGVATYLHQLATPMHETEVLNAIQCAEQKRGESVQPLLPLFFNCMANLYPDVPLGLAFAYEDHGISVFSSHEDVVKILESGLQSQVEYVMFEIEKQMEWNNITSYSIRQHKHSEFIRLTYDSRIDLQQLSRGCCLIQEVGFYRCPTRADALPVLHAINRHLRKEIERHMSSDLTLHSADSHRFFSIKQDVFNQASNMEKAYQMQNPLFARLIPLENEEIGWNSPVVGLVLESDTSTIRQLNELFAREDIQQLMPEDMNFAWSYDAKTISRGGIEAPYLELIAIQDLDQAPVNVHHIQSAKVEKNLFTGEYGVRVEWSPVGAANWNKMYTGRLGHVAIMFDGSVYTYHLQKPLVGHTSYVTCGVEQEKAEELAHQMMSGFRIPFAIKDMP